MTDFSVAQIPGLSAIASDYRGILCDVWGVLHNGVAVFPAACDALKRYRETGGAVILLTNAPRPSEPVAVQLDRLGVPRTAYDDIVTSGDTTRDILQRDGIKRLHHLGPDRDLPLFEGLSVDRVGIDDAEIVVCTGLFDERRETPEDYLPQLRLFKERGLRLLCANPDVVVEVGDTLYWCAGALAREFSAIGGEVVMPGKPHAPIYRTAAVRLEEAAEAVLSPSEILAVGDGLPTDIAGAVGQGIAALFISSGIHAADFGDADAPDPALISRRLNEEKMHVVGAMPRLRW